MKDGEENYIDRAKELLRDLFKEMIEHTEIFRGKKRIGERYSIIYSDGTEKKLLGITSFGRGNPFAKKEEWRFNIDKGCFAVVQN